MVTIYSDLLDERLERSAHGHANGHGRVDFFTTRSIGSYILGRAVRASGFAHGGWQVSWGRTHFTNGSDAWITRHARERLCGNTHAHPEQADAARSRPLPNVQDEK
jgi:hypothetical protein